MVFWNYKEGPFHFGKVGLLVILGGYLVLGIWSLVLLEDSTTPDMVFAILLIVFASLQAWLIMADKFRDAVLMANFRERQAGGDLESARRDGGESFEN